MCWAGDESRRGRPKSDGQRTALYNPTLVPTLALTLTLTLTLTLSLSNPNLDSDPIYISPLAHLMHHNDLTQ